MPVTINTSPIKIRDDNDNFINVLGATSESATEIGQLADVEIIGNPEAGQILMYLPIFDENNNVIAAKWINTQQLSIVCGNMDNYENPVLFVEITGGTEIYTNPGLILDVLFRMVSSPYIWYENDDSFNTIKQVESTSGNNYRIICNNGDTFEVNQETGAFELVSSQENTSQNVKLAYRYLDEHQTNLLALVNKSSNDIVSIDANDIQDYLENGNGQMFITYPELIVYAIRELQYFRDFPRITLMNEDVFECSSSIGDIPVYTLAGGEEEEIVK